MTIDRRGVIAGAAAVAAAACVPRGQTDNAQFAERLRAVERDLGGRLGVSFVAPDRKTLDHRGDELFPLASTFKASLAALALKLEHEGRLDLSQTVMWTKDDLIFHTPFTGTRAGIGATLRELAHAAQTTSDNLAANLVLERVGGPPALTAFWRELGDDSSRLDRLETQLNLVPPGEIRDTTRPAAMARTLSRILGPASPLGTERAAELGGWMVDSVTGLAKVRAGLPGGWRAGDKTGNSSDWDGRMGYLRGDIGFVERSAGSTVFFAAYHQSPLGGTIADDRVDAAFAEIGSTLASWIRTLPAI